MEIILQNLASPILVFLMKLGKIGADNLSLNYKTAAPFDALLTW